MKSFARDQNEPDPSNFQTPIPLRKILFTYSTILPEKSIDRRLCKILFTYSTILPGKSIDRRLFSSLFDSVHVQAVGTKSERAGAEITTRGEVGHLSHLPSQTRGPSK